MPRHVRRSRTAAGERRDVREALALAEEHRALDVLREGPEVAAAPKPFAVVRVGEVACIRRVQRSQARRRRETRRADRTGGHVGHAHARTA
jgi:hypothetical protein